jgi:phosphatidylinositol alpha-1,6-mannosyltransferase
MSAGERYKGHDELLNAWPLVLRSLPDARLVFAGGGDDEPRLRARSEQLGIAASVHFTGFISHDELLGWYARSALFAMPSRNEGFGIVYLEAMAHALPCLASTHDAAREVVEDGVTGALVDPDNLEALAGTTSRLLSDPHLRIRLGRCGRRRVRERFSYEVFRDRLLPILDARLGSSSIIATASL